jgi:hypothetical protein
MDLIGEELERLASLRDKGDLTEEEYEKLKENLISETDTLNSSTSIKPNRKRNLVILGTISILAVAGVLLGLFLTSNSDTRTSSEQAWIDLTVEEIDWVAPVPGISPKDIDCALGGLIDEIGFKDVKAAFKKDDAGPRIMRSFFTALTVCVDMSNVLARTFLEDEELGGTPPGVIECMVESFTDNTDFLVSSLMMSVTDTTSDAELDALMAPIMPDFIICFGESLSGDEIMEIFNSE